MKEPATINEYYMAKNGLSQMMQVAEHCMFDSIEKEVQEYDDFLTSQTKSLRDIKSNYGQLKDYHETLKTAAKILAKIPVNKNKWAMINRSNMLERVSEKDNEESKEFPNKKKSTEEDEADFRIKIGHLIGTIATVEKLSFKRLIFRATRGNVLVQFEDIHPKKNKPEKDYRSSFIITFQEGTAFREKLERMVQAFGAKVYDFPEQDFQRV